MDRKSDNRDVLQDTLHILEDGFNEKGGRTIKLSSDTEARMEAQVLLPEEVEALAEEVLPLSGASSGPCRMQVAGADTFTFTEQLARECGDPAKEILVLNFANAVHPGGGVRRGARAQEEDLCRRSSLLPALEGEASSAFYSYNWSLRSFLGSDAVILTPCVEVVKDEAYEPLDVPFTAAVLTCAAPNVSGGLEGRSREDYKALLYRRICGIFRTAAHFGYRRLVLGAWGCGAFGNDPELVSSLFFRALREGKVSSPDGEKNFNEWFESVDFAVLDRSREQKNRKAFEAALAQFREWEADRDRIRQSIKARERHQDAVRGSLIGGAAGDALGYPVEFMRLSEIRECFGENGIRSYETDPQTGKALISDDTQMTLFTADGILRADTRGKMRGLSEKPAAFIWGSYQAWLRTQRTAREAAEHQNSSWLMDVPELYACRAPGNTCLSALSNGQPGTCASPINHSKGCGGIMRVAPVGLFYNTDPHDGEGTGFSCSQEASDRRAAESAALTHGHPLGYMTAAMASHMISRIVYSKERFSSLGEVVEEGVRAMEALFPEDWARYGMSERIARAAALSRNGESDADNIARLGEGWVAEETRLIAVYCILRYPDDLSAALTAAVNHDGDSDSTGAVTGNILGAWLGFEKIDPKWKKDLELYDVILEVADDLCHGCQMDKHGPFRDPVWEARYIYFRRDPEKVDELKPL